jgi:hypothetical protein
MGLDFNNQLEVLVQNLEKELQNAEALIKDFP